MKRTAILTAILLLTAHAAAAGPNWQVGTFRMDPADVEKLVAATDKLLGNDVGKNAPGTIALMMSVIDGSDPSTHSYITSFDSLADRETFLTQLRATPEWAEFQAQFSELTEPGSNSRMNLLQSWGEGGPEDVVWRIHAFDVEDVGKFTKALDALMESDAEQGFPGQLHLSSIAAAGITQSSHLVSVGFQSEAEAEVWTDALITTDDYAKFLKASGKVAEGDVPEAVELRN